MTELLILAVLFDGENTIYRIRKKILERFSLFAAGSFGSIHPALKKLELSNCISVKRKITSGGKKSSLYTITKSGKKYFEELMTDEIPENIEYSKDTAYLKLLLIDMLDENLQKYTKSNIKRYFEVKLSEIKKQLELLQNPPKNDKENNRNKIALLKHIFDKITSDIRFTESI